MYGLLRGLVLRTLRAPTEPPDPPAGSRASVSTFRASKKLLTLRLVALAVPAAIVVLTMGIVLAAALGSEDAPAAAIVLLGLVTASFAAFCFLQYVLIRLDWDMRYYLVTDRALRIREGALAIREHTWTFANIQNLTIEQGPLERVLGIANLRIQTAGGGGAKPGQRSGGGHGGTLAGIDDAEALRDEILSRIREYRDAGLGDVKPQRVGKPNTAAGARSPRFVEHLREVRDEVAALGRALEESEEEGVGR